MEAEKIQQVKWQTKVEKVIVPTVRKQAFENQKNVELSDMRGAKFDEESSSNKLDLRGSVPDSEGEVTLANYEKSSLSASDLDAGKKEFLSTIKQDPEFSQDSEENLLWYWKEIITAFFNGVNDGWAEYIAKYAPEFTDKILKNSDEYKLAIVLDTEMKKIKIAAWEARIKSLNKLSTTLKWE